VRGLPLHPGALARLQPAAGPDGTWTSAHLDQFSRPAHAILLAVRANCEVATYAASTLRWAGFAAVNDLGDPFPPA
jgi:hypothetical protein